MIKEVDLSEVTSGFLIKKHVEKMKCAINMGKELRSTFSSDQLEVLEDLPQDSKIDELNLAFAVAKMSHVAIESWENSLDLIFDSVSDNMCDLLSYEDIKTVTLFITFLGQLKARSRRHLDNFLSAVADGEWVDALIVGKNNDSEFRTIDRCSDEARSEFGLKN